ncbi:MAG: lysine exporter protein [Proteobacteria bacterium]|jgi:threonine/homoserine/homoserine lactone efflux protein|nr:lysine exporter protein [Pseudomonadota bacterium]MCU0808341.1 LysE family transporter [Candidatus Contendobacter sp.]
MIAFLLSGILLGLSSGLSPGPLLTLVVSETLRHGARAGIGVALAPLLTDLPIILAAVLLLRPLTDQTVPLALINLGGGLYLAWLGIQGVRFRGAELEPSDPAGSLRRGVIANFLNPSPYLFWLAVGAPTVLAAWREGWPAAAVFIVAFYALLVGSKVLLALALGRARHLLRSGGYILLMRGLGLLLLGYALLFLRESGRLLA